MRRSREAPLVLLWLALLCLLPAPALGERPLFGLALEGLPDLAELQAVQAASPVPLGLVNVFLMWPPPNGQEGGSGAFPLATAEAAASLGATLCVTWEPMYLQEGAERVILAEDLLAGSYATYLQRFATDLAAFGRPVFIRFGHEMNLARYHWGAPAEDYGPQSPHRYRAMFRHVAAALRTAGAHNARLVFCPNAESLPDAAWNRAAAYYPGHDVVDALGMDGYNWGSTRTQERDGWQSRWQSFPEIFRCLWRELRALAPDKPVYVFETASTDQGGDKALWLEELARTVRDWELAGLVWFEIAKEVDWRLGTGLTPDHADVAPLRAVFGP